MSNRRGFLKLLGLAPAMVATATVADAKPAELTLEQAVAELEKGRVVKQGLLASCCQTGSSYLSITHAGLKEEGKPFLGFTPTRKQAIERWLNTALLYANSNQGTLYWRTRPEVDCREFEGGKCDWMVYSRFVISDGYEVFHTVDDLLHTRRVQPHYAESGKVSHGGHYDPLLNNAGKK